jgi:hypothetical protein
MFMTLLICCFSGGGGDAMAVSVRTERAIWSARIMVPPEARHEFMGQVEKFAQREVFVVRKGQPRGDNVHFLIEMEREDIRMTVLNPFNDPAEFDCFIYQAGSEPVPPHVIEALSNKFIGDVGLVSGVSVMLEK